MFSSRFSMSICASSRTGPLPLPFRFLLSLLAWSPMSGFRGFAGGTIQESRSSRCGAATLLCALLAVGLSSYETYRGRRSKRLFGKLGSFVVVLGKGLSSTTIGSSRGWNVERSAWMSRNKIRAAAACGNGGVQNWDKESEAAHPFLDFDVCV